MTANSLHARDIASLVHQQTDLHRHSNEGATLIARGEGCRVWDTDGREYIEAMAGLWYCASLGFSERRLADAAHAQMLKLPYYHTFFQKGHEPAVELAERLLAVAPPGMARVLFQCSGSEANDAAIKLIWYTNEIVGRPEKRKIIGRVRGYHGNTVATVSLSGQPHMHQGFGLPVARLRAHRQPELLPLPAGRRDRGGVQPTHGGQPRAADPGRRAGHRCRVLCRTGAGRRRRDHAAAGVFCGDPGGAAEIRRAVHRR